MLKIYSFMNFYLLQKFFWLFIDFFCQFFNKSSALLLYKINLDVFKVIDFFQIFQIFCYIAKYWNSDQSKFLVGIVCAIHP